MLGTDTIVIIYARKYRVMMSFVSHLMSHAIQALTAL